MTGGLFYFDNWLAYQHGLSILEVVLEQGYDLDIGIDKPERLSKSVRLETIYFVLEIYYEVIKPK